MSKVTASFEFSGYSDYWSGNGRRWDCNAGCAFAFYGTDTTLRDIVDQWVEEFSAGNGEFDEWPESIDSEDVRQAILDMLTEQGRADYESGAIWEGCVDEDDFDEDMESPVCIVLLEYEKCQDCAEPVGDNDNELCEACNEKHYGAEA